MTSGWYHYNAVEHSLELLNGDCTAEDVTAICAGQPHVGDAGFLLVLTSMIERQLGHHGTARAYRVCLLDAGHLGQTFALTAVALGLAPFELAAYSDARLTDRLGLDGVTQIPVHVVGAGLPGDGGLAATPASLEAFRAAQLSQPELTCNVSMMAKLIPRMRTD